MSADKLAQECGALAAQLRNMRAEFLGEGMKPQAGCHFYTAAAGDASVLVEYEYEAGEASQTSGPPERCYEGYAASVSVIQALVNGMWCDPNDVFPESLIERWAEEIAEHEDVNARADYEDAMEARAEARRDERMEAEL